MKTMPKIEVGATDEMHLLRHYHAVPEKYLHNLLGKKFEFYDARKKQFVNKIVTRWEIKKALNAKGKSRFYANVPGIETPRKIIALVKIEAQKRALHWQDVGEALTTSFIFTYSKFVGNDIPERSTRKTRRIGVEFYWPKNKCRIYVTAYPYFRS